MTLVQSRQCLLDIHVNGIQSYSISCSFLQDLYFKFVNTLVHISAWTKQIPFLFVGKPSITENKLSLRILQICWEITFITHHRRMQHRVAICGWDWMDGTSGGRDKKNITLLIITLECTSRQYENMTMRQLQVL